MSYLWNSNYSIEEEDQVFQLKIFDISLEITFWDLKDFLSAISQTKMQCTCNKCNSLSRCKAIQFTQQYSELKIKVNAIELKAIRNLVQGTLFKIELNTILEDLSIN